MKLVILPSGTILNLEHIYSVDFSNGTAKVIVIGNQTGKYDYFYDGEDGKFLDHYLKNFCLMNLMPAPAK